MVRTTTQNYEVSSESSRERHVRIPYARLEDATPILHDPAAVLSAIPGNQITGTVITMDAVNSVVVMNTADGAVYWHNVRTATTYFGGFESAWAVVNIGDPVHYDRSAGMPATTKLSLAAIDITLGANNALFGHVVLGRGETAASYPKNPTGVAATIECAIEQV